MSIIFQCAFRMISNQKRTCPKCKRDQIVARQHGGKTVLCKFCGASLPSMKRGNT